MSELERILALIQEYGITLVVIVLFGIGVVTGFIRLGREVKREESATSREKDATAREKAIGDEKQRMLDSLVGEMRGHTSALNAIAAGIEERNRIERESRGRRT